MSDYKPMPKSVITEVLNEFCTKHGLDTTQQFSTVIKPITGQYVRYKGKIYQYTGEECYRKMGFIERLWRGL